MAMVNITSSLTNTNEDTVAEDQEIVESLGKGSLRVVFPQTRSKSPVTVQEWVAALPDGSQDREEEERDHTEDCIEEETDNLTLGAEAGGFAESRKLFVCGNGRNKRGAVLHHTDTMASVQSDLSHNSNTSMNSVFQSREADPEQVLVNLGFAGSEALARIPKRFLKQPSQAKGVSVEGYKKQQDELIGRFESGFFGYRGLQGNLHRRPSELVEKILKTLKDKGLHRKGSTMSWSSPSYSGTSAIPTRFKTMDPKRTTFDSLVTQVSKTTAKEKVKPKSFQSLAKSVLSPENRVWRQEQIDTNKRRAAQLLIMGGKSFLVDDDGNEEELIKSDTECHNLSPMQARLKKQDSLQSIQSSNSFDSDWSDEEQEELEKKFGGMSNRSEKTEKSNSSKRGLRRSRSSKRSSKASLELEGAQLVYSRDSSVSVSDVASSLDGVCGTFADQCIPEEVELEKNFG